MTGLFLITFFVGFGLTLVSAVLGAVHAGDLGHGHGDLGHGDLGHGDLCHGDAGSSDATHGPGHGHGQAPISSISPINFQTLMGALMGFGGAGYIALRMGFIGMLISLPLAACGAVLCGWLILQFQRLMVRGERPMAPTSYIGVVGTLTMPIREKGTGELVYSMNDVRQVLAARSVNGKAIGKGEEVMVLRYERGIAYVQPWREVMAEKDTGR